MEVYTARQAILNRRQQVSAYELFFRDGPENYFPQGMDAHQATSKLIGRTHFNRGIRPVTSGKRALINFSEESILQRLPFLLPKEDILVEILETTRPTDEVYQACVELYRAGYHLVLDDFVYKKSWHRFLKLVRLIKFDISVTPLNKIAPLVTKLRESSSIKLLAEKVETKEEHEHAMSLGFHFFQGYYFCKPEMQTQREVASNEQLLMLLYRETMSNTLNYKSIAHILENDSSLTYKLLCYVNSGGFPLKSRITSVKQALTYLGDQQLRRLMSLFVTAILANDKPTELTKMCVIRAKFCQLVANKAAPSLSDSAFLAGMFSLLDVILDADMESVLNRLPVSEEIEEVLLDSEDKSQTPLSIALRTIKHLEAGSWYLSEKEAYKLNLDKAFIAQCYQDAIKWSEYFDAV